jgi:H+-translocating NAD(P) transhydrogenase subunit alpha
MSFLDWLLQVVVFFVVLKLAQIVFWNVRKAFYVHPWLVEIVVAILVLWAVRAFGYGWWLTVALAILFGIVRGDQEADEERGQRQLL